MGKMSPFCPLLLALVALTGAQDTFHCPDGWLWHEHNGGGRCYLFSNEAVTKSDADILCAFHGGYLAEVDAPGINYWIKSVLIERTLDTEGRAHPDDQQFWIGSVTEDHHDDHVNGNWRWQHSNVSVQWFDWGQNEPNDYHTVFTTIAQISNCMHVESMFTWFQTKN